MVRAVFFSLTLGLVLGACGNRVEPFEGAAPSLEALGEHVLDALSTLDAEALERVRLTEFEHNEVVWPELPASDPEANFPVDFAWANIQTRNGSALARVDQFYRDREPVLESVECRGGVQSFESFDVLTDCWVTFTSGNSGELFEAQVFKDVLVRGGGYKIFRYYDEVPERMPDAQAP